MSETEAPHDGSNRLEDRCAGFETEDGFVVYDTENEAAWIESDTTHTLKQ